MAGAIKDYLSTGTADYTATTLNINPQKIMVESGEFRQESVEYDDNTFQVLTFSTASKWSIRIKWDAISAANANTIFDFYMDTAKAKGMARSFKFYHPIDKIYYVCKFASPLSREAYTSMPLRAIPDIVLRVISYYAS